MNEQVSYIVFEGEMTRLERIIRRLWILCLVLLIALLSTNISWVYYNSQSKEFKTYETDNE